MNPFRISHLKKTYYYLKKNGLRAACAAVEERLKNSRGEAAAYTYRPPSEACLQKQRDTVWDRPLLFSVIVPAYETKPVYLEALLRSLLSQTYENWELILADASRSPADSSRSPAERAETAGAGTAKAETAGAETAEAGIAKVETTKAETAKAETAGAETAKAETAGAGTAKADGVKRIAERFRDGRIRYCRLPENRGIARNTNAALEQARGEYVCLLDHDDVLTPDALFEMASMIGRERRQGRRLRLLYSDEDKTDETGEHFFEEYRKPDFNESLLLSNNYICHFLVMERELALSLRERPAYDGAQDYDLILRAAGMLAPDQIGHVPRVLYHWRCHSASTAVNPRSKQYAYEAGRRAVQDYCDAKGWQAEAEHTRHLGFYRLRYQGGILAQRPEVGAVGGRIVRRRRYGRFGLPGRARIAGGLYGQDGSICFAGLPVSFSGPMHRAVLQQDAYAVDIRCVRVQPALQALLEQYRERLSEGSTAAPGRGRLPEEKMSAPAGVSRFDSKRLPYRRPDRRLAVRRRDELARELSLQFCQEVRKAGYRIVWDPFLQEEGNEA